MKKRNGENTQVPHVGPGIFLQKNKPMHKVIDGKTGETDFPTTREMVIHKSDATFGMIPHHRSGSSAAGAGRGVSKDDTVVL